MAKKFVFEGPRQEFDAAADYAIVLSHLQHRRGNLIAGCCFLVLFTAALLVFIRFHDARHALPLLALCLLLLWKVWDQYTGWEAVRSLKRCRRDRQRQRSRGRYCAGSQSGPVRITFSDGQFRIALQEGREETVYRCEELHTVLECEAVYWIVGEEGRGFTLPKNFLAKGSEEEFRRWLEPTIENWYVHTVPSGLKRYLET